MTTVVAHRGASAAFGDNTLAAFQGAADLGADAVELDVRRTADGALAVHHDAHLADGRALVEVAAAELPSHGCLLAEALAACGPLVVNVEIKNLPNEPDFDETEAVAGAVVDLVSEVAMQDRVLVSSFSLRTIDRVRELAPDLATAWLVYQVASVEETVARTLRHGHRTLHPWVEVLDRALVETAHDAGLVVNTWTVDDPFRMQELIDLGVDGIITNVPDVARAVVDGRGANHHQRG
ncbi:glycerophosphodiester phosphodiesterase [soil metagenome]